MTKATTTVSTEKMFEMMMASMGLNMVGVTAEVVTNMVDEIDEYAMDIEYHFDDAKDAYISDMDSISTGNGDYIVG